MSITTFIIIFLLIGVFMIILSLIVEALRKPPETPQSLYWDKDIPIQYVDIDGLNIRYIKTGQGPDLVLLHTLRTQLDIFQKIIPELSSKFTVYALDYPGHGFSDITTEEYRPEMFVKYVERFLDKMNIKEATLAGISIGGTIVLQIAAKRNPAVAKVVAINPYDYGRGSGVRRGNFVANLIFGLAKVPIIGDTLMRLRNKMVETRIMQGGVSYNEALPEEFLDQLYAVGERKGHYKAFLNLIRNAHLWDEAHSVYGKINTPALIIYGEKDWSYKSERNKTVSEISEANAIQVPDGSHFLSLDQPDELIKHICDFAYKTT